MRALIIEDSAVDRRIVTKNLKEWGYQFSVTTNGKDGWQALQAENAPKLVIMDWMLPDTEGVELCRKIRKIQGKPYTYIMLVTARNQKRDMLRAMGVPTSTRRAGCPSSECPLMPGSIV